MDRDRALQYFKQLGFTSAPLQLYGQRRYLSPRESIEEGDGISGRNLWHLENEDLTEPEQLSHHAQKEPEGIYGARPPSQAVKQDYEKDTKSRVESEQNWVPISVSMTCSCARSGRTLKSPGTLTSPRHCTEGDPEGTLVDSEDEEEGDLTLDQLLLMMVRTHNRPVSSAASTTLLRLACCFSPIDTLTQQQINQLMNFLVCQHTMVKEAALKILEQLLTFEKSWIVVEEVDLVDRIITLALDESQPSSIQTLAMHVLDKILNVTELDYNQIRERLETEVYPSLVQCLHGKDPLERKYSACCLVRSLARDVEFAARIKKESLFLLRQLRDSSARLKEVYVGVLMAMFAHPGLTEAGSVDTGILPVLKGLLRDGPCETQKQALELLQCVMSDDRGVEVVSKDQRIVAYVMACLLTSKCRKVRMQAGMVSATLTSLHRVGVARSLLEGIGRYIQPQDTMGAGLGAEGMARITYPVPAKNQADTHLWHNLDCFLDAVAGLLHSEGLLEMETDHIYSELPLKGEISNIQLACLSYLVQLVNNMCTWPLQRRMVGFGNAQVARLDLTHLCDDLAIREKYSALNHRMAVQQWKRFGPKVFAVLHWMTARISTHLHNNCAASGNNNHRSATSEVPSRPSSAKMLPKNSTSSRPSSGKTSPVLAKEVLSEGGWLLLHSLLNFLLSMTLLSCKTIADPFSREDEPKSCVPINPAAKKPPPSGLWVSENPHLTHGVSKTNKTMEDISRKQQEDLKKEAVSDRRVLRRGLYNEGLFDLLGPLMQLADVEVKTMCFLILRAAVQPLDEKVQISDTQCNRDPSSNPSYTSFGHSSVTGKMRPQSAHPTGSMKTAKVINIALHRMSPASATLVRDALGSFSTLSARSGSSRALTSSQRLTSVAKGTVSRDSIPARPDSVTSVASTHRTSSSLSGKDVSTSDLSNRSTAPSRCQSQPRLCPLVPGQPINRECQREAAVACGGHVIQNLFSRSRRMKLYCLMFLHDLIKFTAVEIHMELSKLGIVPKLLDFVRVNDDDEQLEILGLRVLELLMMSDLRLQQLFSHHGGHTLLMALSRNTSPSICGQVKATLAAVTRGQRFQGAVRGKRPVSAPVNRHHSSPAGSFTPPADIWDHIMQRWAEEDKVVQVLQKFK